ncbi:histone-lysine N-methyltransferase SETMAR-like [Halyomorpha halys]|uniref:histone-lysine N-methyltransferase SETMAR-like n=1 Tax=Halyomorpha halys TaxID=286706 RepID=UPI0034D2BB96
MKLGSTTIPQRQNSSEGSGNMLSHRHQRKQRQYVRPEMASVFWDAKGILLIDDHPTGETITGKYYANLLDQLQEGKRYPKKGLVWQGKKSSFIKITPAITQVQLPWENHELRYELLPHPPYSLDLAPSDFHLFPKLQIFLGGRRFPKTEELTAELERYFAGLEESHFRDGIKASLDQMH